VAFCCAGHRLGLAGVWLVVAAPPVAILGVASSLAVSVAVVLGFGVQAVADLSVADPAWLQPCYCWLSPPQASIR